MKIFSWKKVKSRLGRGEETISRLMSNDGNSFVFVENKKAGKGMDVYGRLSKAKRKNWKRATEALLFRNFFEKK